MRCSIGASAFAHLTVEMTKGRKRLGSVISDPPQTGEGDHPKGGGGAHEVYAALDGMGPNFPGTSPRSTTSAAWQTDGAPPPASLVPLPVPGRIGDVRFPPHSGRKKGRPVAGPPLKPSLSPRLTGRGSCASCATATGASACAAPSPRSGEYVRASR